MPHGLFDLAVHLTACPPRQTTPSWLSDGLIVGVAVLVHGYVVAPVGGTSAVAPKSRISAS